MKRKQATSASSWSVLLAEDNVISQRVAAALLTSLGHKVTLCNNGREAVEAVEGGSFDILLMDLRMPVLDGLGAAAEIRRLADPIKARIPILAISANVRDDDVESCRAQGILQVVTKPLRGDTLARLMERCVVPSTTKSPGQVNDNDGDLLDQVHISALQEALSPQKLAELYGLARDSLQVSAASLRDGWQSGDQKKIVAAAHRLAGVSRNFGCLALGRCAARIENTALKGEDSAIDQAPFEQLLAASLAALPT